MSGILLDIIPLVINFVLTYTQTAEDTSININSFRGNTNGIYSYENNYLYFTIVHPTKTPMITPNTELEITISSISYT